MIGLDTNVLVRMLVLDDPAQNAKVRKFVKTLTSEQPGYLTLITLVETYWVLTRSYHQTKDETLAILESLLEFSNLKVENVEAAHWAIRQARKNHADFADALIARQSQIAGARQVVTFDRAAAQTLGWRLL